MLGRVGFIPRLLLVQNGSDALSKRADVGTTNPDAASAGGGDGDIPPKTRRQAATSDRNVSPDARLTIDVTDATLAALSSGGSGSSAGFEAFLAASDALEVKLAAEVRGNLLVLDAAQVQTTTGAQTETRRSDLALALYVIPEGMVVPANLGDVPEADLIKTFGLIRLGEVDLGQRVTQTDLATGIVTVAKDTAQTGVPQILSNRGIVTSTAVLR